MCFIPMKSRNEREGPSMRPAVDPKVVSAENDQVDISRQDNFRHSGYGRNGFLRFIPTGPMPSGVAGQFLGALLQSTMCSLYVQFNSLAACSCW